MSNWENRPLRHSQEHYAALDAWILTVLIELMDKLVKKIKTKNNLIKTIGKPDLQKVPQTVSKSAPQKESKNRLIIDKTPDGGSKKAEVNQVPDISKIKEYESEIEHHKKKLAHFQDLLK